MALDFILSPVPWDTIAEDMYDNIPAGRFYLQSITMAPRSEFKTEFLLATDNLTATVDIFINNELMLRHRPISPIDRVKLPLVHAPGTNSILVTNNIDAPVHLSIASTHLAKYMFVYATQIYEFSGALNERFLNLIRSPWASFIAEYQMPWQRELPEVRSWRSMAVKFIANCIYNESGRQGGVTDLVTGFCQSTPVITAPVNTELWQPDLYQPQTAAHDESGFDMHIWLPNLCLNQWLAFITITDHVDFYRIRRMNEQVVTIQETGEEIFEQHRFGSVDLAVGATIDNLGPGCDVLGLIEFLGCMDRIDVSGDTIVLSSFVTCAWASPFDEQVESPGIGTEFFDAGAVFDTGTHIQPDETNEITTVDAISVPTAATLATEIKADFNAHDLDAVPLWHHTTGGSWQITAAIPFDTPSTITFALDAQAQYTAHINDALMHIPIDDLHPLVPVVVIDLPTSLLLINDLKVKFNLHVVTGHFDSVYDVDLLSDWWVGVNTTKRFDFGSCLDSFTTVVQIPKDASCCETGPDAIVLSTLALDASAVSLLTPPNPVFGGDDPGLLINPYFNP